MGRAGVQLGHLARATVLGDVIGASVPLGVEQSVADPITDCPLAGGGVLSIRLRDPLPHGQERFARAVGRVQ